MEPIVKSFDRPDERPELPKGHAELLHLGEQIVVRGELEPGWRWSNDWQPLMGTASCQMPHTGLVLSGRWHFEMDDGTGVDLGPGDVFAIPAGHDAWVVGDEPVRTIDWAPAHDEATRDVLDAATNAPVE
ncbi:MAG TPA: cupin domain-containing protein [Actinomycetota bacterium]|jgi:hypothetical protein